MGAIMATGVGVLGPGLLSSDLKRVTRGTDCRASTCGPMTRERANIESSGSVPNETRRINALPDELNRETEEVLEYQVIP